EQASGAVHRFSVVRMPQGERRQLIYDLAARVVDAEDLPVNTVIVSPWARTGWNVVRPNVLVDATATRDVTAWQQLRGRALRARRSWDHRCHRLVTALLGHDATPALELEGLTADAADQVGALHAGAGHPERLDRETLEVLAQAVAASDRSDARTLADRVRAGRLGRLPARDRADLVAVLMLAKNKVTHIYELLKASGSSPQVHRDRRTGRWVRTPAVAAKHAREHAVDPLTGGYGAGAGHAPLVLAGDPRQTVPSRLRHELEAALRGADPRIVKGWISALLAGPEDG
ncbi:MAG: hypothetical protein ACYDA8_23705, partial [Deferrisomatales bacterium]